jgi:hypothetical protein
MGAIFTRDVREAEQCMTTTVNYSDALPLAQGLSSCAVLPAHNVALARGKMSAVPSMLHGQVPPKRSRSSTCVRSSPSWR